MNMMGPGVYHLSLRLANVYLIEGRCGLALVDAGGQGALRALEPQLRSSRFRLSDIRYILATHGHFDHVGGSLRSKPRPVQQCGLTVLTRRSSGGTRRWCAPTPGPLSRSLRSCSYAEVAAKGLGDGLQ